MMTGMRMVWAGVVVLSLLAMMEESHALGRKRPNPEPEPEPANEFRVAEVVVAGTACQGGSSRIQLSSDHRTVTLLPGAGVAEIGGESGRRIDRRSCNLALRVDNVPEGRRVVMREMRVAADVDLAAGAKAKLSQEIFLAGQQGRLSERAAGSPDRPVTQALELIDHPDEGTECGGAGLLRANTSLLLQAPGDGPQPISAGELRELRVSLELEDCS